jgi:DNA-binding transcriptional MerR regulator
MGIKHPETNVELIKISELAKLAEVPTPTIKHYMNSGLLPEPALRTSRNMAYYDPILASRIRVIKDLQQTYFFPLKVICELLEEAPSAKIRAELPNSTIERLGQMAPAIEAGYAELRRQRRLEETQGSRTRDQLLQSFEITDADLDELKKLGLIDGTPGEEAHEESFAGRDLELLQVIHETRQRGLGDLFPISILKPYQDALRNLVRTELDLFRKRVLDGTTLPDQPLDEITTAATELSEKLIVAMRSRLILSELGTLAKNID